MPPVFEVIVPVVNLDLLGELLKSIYKNTLLPKKVILIDNSKKPMSEIFDYIPNNGIIFEVYYSQTGFVNESINLGITKLSEKCEYVSVLNDDIILGTRFFKRNAALFQEASCAVACPYTVDSLGEMGDLQYNPKIMNRREGWAVTISKRVLDKIPLFPSDRIAIFHWDDWIWFYVKEQKMFWWKDMGNVIYHAIGSSVDRLGFKLDPVHGKKAERNKFEEIVREHGWGRGL